MYVTATHSLLCEFPSTHVLRKKSPYSELFWSAFSPRFPAFGHKESECDKEYLSVFSPNAGKCVKNADQNNAYFLRSDD